MSDKSQDRGKVKVGGIMKRRDLVLVGVMSAPDRPGLAAAIFQAIGEAQMNAEFIVQCIDLQNMSHVLFCVAEDDAPKVSDLLIPIADDLNAAKVTTSHHVSLLSVFGPDFRELPGIAGRAFSALASKEINILAVSTSISTITCVVDDKVYGLALEALKEVFALP